MEVKSIKERLEPKLRSRGFYWQNNMLVKPYQYSETFFDNAYRNATVWLKIAFEKGKCYIGHEDWEENTITDANIEYGECEEIATLEQVETYHRVILNQYFARKDLEPAW